MKNIYSLKKIFLLVFSSLYYIMPLNAIELTVCDGTATNEYLPIYGYYLDSKPLHHQMIYPAALLAEMKEKNIQGLSFYLQSSSNAWQHEEMNISLGETERGSFESASYITDHLTTVFSTSLLGDAGEDILLTVLFDSPFLYKKGNLIIDFETKVKGNKYSKMLFYGLEQEISTALRPNSWGNNSVLENFLPKVTFIYDEPQEYSVDIIPGKLDFPQTIIGASSTLSLTIHNKGLKSVSAQVSGLDNTAFHIAEMEKLQNINAGTKIELPIIYTPAIGNDNLATMTIDMGKGGTFNIELSGTSILVPDGYQESFDNITATSVLPAGWSAWSIIENTNDQTINGQENSSKFSVYNQNGTQGIMLSGVNPYNDFYSKTNTSYYLISPYVSGEVCLFVRKTSDYSTATVKFYPVSLENDTCIIEENEIIAEWSAPLSYNEWSIVRFSLSEGKHIAIFLNYVAIDLFAADQATGNKAIQLVQLTDFPSSVIVDATGKATISVSLSVKNEGLSLISGEDYSFSIYDSESPQTRLKEIAGIDIPMGKTIQQKITFDYVVTDLNDTISKKFIIKENLSETSLTTEKIEIYPYKPYLLISKPAKEDAIIESINLGLFKGERILPLQIKNTGTAPLTIESINLMKDVTLNCSSELGNLTLKPTESISLQLLFSLPGTYKGKALNIQCNADGISSVRVEGECLEEKVFFEDFETMLTEKWLIGSWVKKDRGSYPYYSETDYNKSLLSSTNSSNSLLITPELISNAESGMDLTLSAYANDENSSLSVFRSKDRMNWEKISDITFENTKAFELKKVTLTEGKYYVGIKGNSVAIDDIYGACLAPEKDHDCVITEFTGPQKGMVNYTNSFNITIRNMLEKPDNYQVTLKEDGIIVDKILLEDIIKEESFFLNYTPHSIGEHQLQIIVSADDYSISSVPYTYIAEEEKADLTLLLNKGKEYAEGIPVNAYYDHSASKLLYKPTELKGLSNGMKIVKIAFKHYYLNNVPVWHNIRLWGGNTDIDSLNNNRMSHVNLPLLYTGKCTPAGTKENPQLMSFELMSPIIYTGGNLEFIIAADSTSSARNIHFCYHEVPHGQVEYYQKDCGYTEIYTEAPNYFETGSYTLYSSQRLPMLVLYIEQSPGIVTGIVTGEGLPIEAANLTFIEGAKIYSATTNENGQYLAQIYQTGDNYTVIVEKEGYKKYTEQVQITAGEQTKNFEIEINNPVSTKEKSQQNIRHYLSAEGILHITSPTTIKELILTSSTGTILYEKPINNKKFILNMSKYSLGVYLIMLKTDKGNYTLKVIKK